MNEEGAQEWIAMRFGAQSVDRTAAFLGMVLAETRHQNLIAPSTIKHIWVRHVLDSAQLVPLATPSGTWLDIGTGGGFPGVIVSLLTERPMLLCEPRRKRAEFLRNAVEHLGLAKRVRVEQRRVELLADPVGIISARAVASIDNLFAAAERCNADETRWLLPRGQYDASIMCEIQDQWSATFHVEQSLTDSESCILVADRVRRR